MVSLEHRWNWWLVPKLVAKWCIVETSNCSFGHCKLWLYPRTKLENLWGSSLDTTPPKMITVWYVRIERYVSADISSAPAWWGSNLWSPSHRQYTFLGKAFNYFCSQENKFIYALASRRMKKEGWKSKGSVFILLLFLKVSSGLYFFCFLKEFGHCK